MSAPDQIGDWKQALDELVRLHQHIRDLDHDSIWANEMPRSPATPEDILRVEQALRCELDPRFKAFLLHANGWRAFYQWVDLFGTEELLGERMKAGARRLLELDKAGLLRQTGLDIAKLLPIGITQRGQGAEVPDLFLQVREGGPDKGAVLWLSDEEVDRFPSFDAFYLAMLDYNREEIHDLLQETKDQGRLT